MKYIPVRIVASFTSLLLLAGAVNMYATALTWDANTGTTAAQDGGGTWEGNNWWNGSANATWNSATPDTATIGAASGAAGTISLTAVTCGAITFAAPGSGNYIISGGTLTLSGTPTITMNAAATINSTLSGSGFNVGGTSILTLGGNNNFTGSIGLNTASAVLNVSSDSNLGNTANTVNAGQNATMNLAGGFNGVSTRPATVSNSRIFYLNANSGTATWNGNITQTSSGQIRPTCSSSGSPILVLGSTCTFNGAAATVYTDVGDIRLDGILNNTATLQIGRKSSGTGSWTARNSASITTSSGISMLNTSGGTANLTVQDSATVIAPTLNLNAAGAANTGTVNLNGGTLTVGSVTKTTGTANFNFNGGTLKASANSGTFMTGLTAANVQSGGVKIDDGGFAISIGQNLLTGASPDGGLTKSGIGTLTLSGANTYNGATVLNAGTLQFSSSGNLGAAANGITFNGGTLQWSGNTYDISAKTVTINSGGGTIDVNGNTVALANSIGNSGSGALTVKNTGAIASLTLSGANTFTGGTTVSSGTLKVNNSTGSGTGSGNVTVNSGATLGGSGTISGLVANNGIIAPGNSVGTLMVGSLTMNSGSTYNFEFNSTPANDQIVVTTSGGLTITGGTFNLYQEGTTSAWQPSTTTTYNLIQFSGTAPSLDSTWTTDSASNPHIANLVSGYTYQFGISGGYLTLKVTVAAVLGSWNVDANGSWTTAGNWLGGSVPGANSGSSGDTATFAGVSQSVAHSVTLDANESLGGITMNQAQSFTIANGGNGKTLTLDNKTTGASVSVTAGTANAIQTGVALNDNASVSVSSGKSLAISGVISNATGVTKALTFNGAGTTILSAANIYGPASAGTTGTTLSGGGILQVGNNSALGAGDLSVTASSTIQAGTSVSVGNNIALGSSVTANVDANSSSLNLSGTISGSSAIVNKNTAGTLTLSGANTYSGGTTLSAGQLNINYGGSSSANSAIGIGALTITGGTIDNTSGAAVTLLPNNAQNWNGDFTFLGLAGGNHDLNLGSGTVAMNASRQVTVNDGNLTVGGVISGSGFGLTKTGSGTLTLSGANTFNGTTVVGGGTLTLGHSLALQNSTLNYNNQGGTLSFGSLTAAFIAGLTGSQNLNYGSVNLNLGTNNTTSSYSGSLSGSGQMQKSGTGTLTLVNPGYSGNTIVYNGGLTITGGSLVTSRLDISAQQGVANVTISGGSVTSSSGLYITSPTGGSGTIYGNAANLTVNSGAQVVANADGNGRALSYGSGSNARPGGNGSLTVGTTGDTTTMVTVNGVLDMFVSAGGGTVGNFTVNLNGGTLAVNRIQETTYSANQSGTFKFNGGTLKALADDPSGSVFFIPSTPSQFTTPIYAGGAIIDANSHNITIASVLSHGGGTPDGGLTKLGTGTLTLASSGNTYNGLTTISGGTLNINSEWALGGVNYSGLTFSGSGGTLQYAATLLNSTTDISTQPVSLNANATVDVNGNAINFANPIGNSGSGALTVKSTAANGVLTVQGATSYTGGTIVNSGTLLVNNTTGSGTGSGSVTVQNTATLGGSGTISGAVTVNSGGILAPGTASIGTLTLGSTLSLAGTASFRLNKTGATLTSDQVAGATSVTAGGTLTVTASGDTLADGNTFTLFNVTPSSTFAVTNLPSVSSANWYTANNFRTLTYNVWPTAGNASYTHNKGISLKIAIADLLTHVTGAVSGKTITLTSLGNPGISGASVANNSDYILYTPGSSDANDSFTYTVSDGRGGSATGTVNVVVDTTAVFSQQSPQLTIDGSGNIAVTFHGIPGFTYIVQRSTDLNSWSDLSTHALGVNDSPTFTITDTPGQAAYYRLKWQP